MYFGALGIHSYITRYLASSSPRNFFGLDRELLLELLSPSSLTQGSSLSPAPTRASSMHGQSALGKEPPDNQRIAERVMHLPLYSIHISSLSTSRASREITAFSALFEISCAT